MSTALVFGGSRGIGAACVQALVQDGFDVAYTYVTKPGHAPDLSGQQRCMAYAADVQSPEQVAAAFEAVKKDFGEAPDCIVANSGINVPPSPLAQCSTDDFRRLVEVNIVGAFNVLREAARNVRDGGTIIALTTSLVRCAVPGIGPYSASKAAVECLVRSLSRELAPRNVRVNAVAPGPVDTDLFRAGKGPEALKRSAALSPFNRVGEPAEIAAVVSFLASSRASWVHGQIVQPNGGLV
ncbi:MAG TPA: SDR family oxidoreductase [Castellaniella sp.]|uniref:SDR family oxidoreductase n=1 Tax=Castellaniella sp. TaxID=1955812 RepID=UPI002EEB141F